MRKHGHGLKFIKFTCYNTTINCHGWYKLEQNPLIQSFIFYSGKSGGNIFNKFLTHNPFWPYIRTRFFSSFRVSIEYGTRYPTQTRNTRFFSSIILDTHLKYSIFSSIILDTHSKNSIFLSIYFVKKMFLWVLNHLG